MHIIIIVVPTYNTAIISTTITTSVNFDFSSEIISQMKEIMKKLAVPIIRMTLVMQSSYL